MPLLSGAVVLVTGANGGLGRELVEQALARGAGKVYATARRPQEWNDSRVVPLALDVTNPDSIRAAVTQAQDVTVLINNSSLIVCRLCQRHSRRNEEKYYPQIMKDLHSRTATPHGPSPAEIVSIILLVDVSITETSFDRPLAV